MADRDEDKTADAFLRQLADPGRPVIDARTVAIVVAHPDDETFGCGAALARLDGVTLVHVTDGAPRDDVDARKHGFSGWEAYAKARRDELDAALAVGGARSIFRMSLGLPDQQAFLRLPEIIRSLSDLFEQRAISIVLTHAFEGGHPDHDATAFATVQAAKNIEIIEMPYYRLGPSGPLPQDFLEVPGSGEEHRIDLTPDEKKRKRRMIAAYRTQAVPLSQVSLDFETFRCAPVYDFAALPNNGRIYYEELFDWGFPAERVRERFAAQT
jgi:LmbE family N-acetylglucosaminyl deacetylase